LFKVDHPFPIGLIQNQLLGNINPPKMPNTF